MRNGVRVLMDMPPPGPSLIDCASTGSWLILGIIRHYELNFQVFPEKEHC